MSLQGSLSQLGLADVLQNVISEREGALVLTRGAERAVLYLQSGGLYLLEPEVLGADDVVGSFVHRGLLDPEALRAARRATGGGTRMIDHLVRDGQLDEVELHRILSSAAEDGVLDLLAWSGGDFRFEEGVEHPRDAGLLARTCVDAGGVLLRAAQRLDERNAIADALGLNAYLFSAVAGTEVPPGVDEEMALVHASLDGQRTLDEVALLGAIGRFAALRAAYHLAQAGLARPANAEELATQVEVRAKAGQYATARALLLQWSGLDPTDPTPLQRLASLATANAHAEDMADALTSLGHLLLHRGAGREALKAFQEVVAKRPDDPRALAGMRLAAEAVGDVRTLHATTMRLAQVALDENQPERAAQLMSTLVSRPDATLVARTLNARALVRLKDREGLLTEAEAVARLIGSRCRKKDEREAAAFFRDAVAGIAPERTDLLRTYRVLCEKGRGPSRRVALVGALLVLAAVGGYVLLGSGPGEVLDRAQAALDAGDTAGALQLLADIVDRYPESPEAEEAFLLQSRLRQPPKPTQTAVVTKEDREAVEAAVARALEALDGLPAPDAIASVADLAALMGRSELVTLRRPALQRLDAPLDAALRRLDREARLRADGLVRAHNLAGGYKVDTEDLRRFVAMLASWRADDWSARAELALESAVSLRKALEATAAGEATEGLQRSLLALQQAWRGYAEDVNECRRMLVGRDLEAEYETCRAEAPKMLVAGRLADVASCYASLEGRLAELAADPVLAPLHESARKRRMPEFLQERRAVLDEIHRGLAAASAAEAVDDLAAATTAYAALAKKFWYVRFEDVFTLPVRVRTVPAGARVSVNGKEAGPSPVVARYAWGSSATITVSAPGYLPVTEVLGTRPEQPSSELLLALAPAPLWTAPVDATVTAPAVGVGPNVLVCDRTGRVTLHAAEDGRVMWARHLRSLEGVRARALATGGTIAVPFIDGRVVFLDPRDGEPQGEARVGRPVGEAALLEDLIAVATQDGRLVALRGRKPAFDAPLPATLSAGLVAAHGAVWLGTVDGQLVRVDAAGRVRATRLGEDYGAVVGLLATEKGFLASTGKGNLYMVAPDGRVLWRAAAVGDVVGAPALAGGTAAVVDRRGRVLLFAYENGDPRGQIDLGGEPRGGLLASEGMFVAVSARGHLWIYAPGSDRTTADLDVGSEALFPPSLLDGGLLAAPGPGRTLQVLPLRSLHED